MLWRTESSKECSINNINYYHIQEQTHPNEKGKLGADAARTLEFR